MNGGWLSADDELLAESALGVASQVAEAPPIEGWAILSEQGWPGVLVPPELGGFGGGWKELLILARALGQAGARTPFIWSCAMTAALLTAGDAQQQRSWGAALASGQTRIGIALQEIPRDAGAEHVKTRATAHGDGYVMTGAKFLVLYAADADLLLVNALAPGSDGGEETSVFLVPPSAPGVGLRTVDLVDGSSAAQVTFSEVALEADARLAGPSSAARRGIAEAARIGAFAAVGEGLGCLEQALGQTVEHLKTRHQFGSPLASLQVLRHRVADMYIAIEELRSLALGACQATPDDRDLWVAAAKIHLGRAGVWAAEQAVQLHGAMGVTEECEVGRILRRITMLDRLFGGADHHIAKLGSRLPA